MLNNFLNLEGVTVLNKKQQKDVHGGGQCIIRAYTNGVLTSIGVASGMADNEASETAGAHAACAYELNNGATNCYYDCAHDGFETLQ
jgi:hypothetical protein